MRKTYTAHERYLAIVEAATTLFTTEVRRELAGFEKPVVRDAFRTHHRRDIAFLIMEHVRHRTFLNILYNSPAPEYKNLLDWAKIAKLAEDYEIPVRHRVEAVVAALRSQEKFDFESRAVLKAFVGSGSPEVAYIISRHLKADTQLAVLARSEIARAHIDWAKVERLARKFSNTLQDPRPRSPA